MAIYIANDRQEGRSAQNKSKPKRDFVLGVQVQGVYVYEVVLLLWSRSPQSGGLSRQDVGPPPPGMEEKVYICVLTHPEYQIVGPLRWPLHRWWWSFKIHRGVQGEHAPGGDLEKSPCESISAVRSRAVNRCLHSV